MSGEAGRGPLCERLDEQLLRYLEEMEQLNDRRERLERLMEQGWFSLSKARYSMGTNWVSSLQYGPEMVPLARVDVRKKTVTTTSEWSGWTLESKRVGPSWKSAWRLRRSDPKSRRKLHSLQSLEEWAVPGDAHGDQHPVLLADRQLAERRCLVGPKLAGPPARGDVRGRMLPAGTFSAAG
ncbi:coiled-coil domain-containing protein 115 isoform X2 [Mobula birostris]|uniref:coiled-coil domain-containing protein 115 isoform X2 n=1 Tax=Mobula birostris TaxID=1983395 RepID=UPI003B27FFC4